MDPDIARMVELDGCLNFRDLGGHITLEGRRLRSGQLYRSDALHFMTEADVRNVRDKLGVRMVIDLRSSSEVSHEGIGPLPAPPVDYHHLPLFEAGQNNVASTKVSHALEDQYLLILRTARKPIARVLQILADSSTPAVFHCAAGKDRTGVISAVLLSLLGVPDSEIIEDYVLTTRNLDRIIKRLREAPSYRAVFDRVPPSTLHARPETMASFLDQVRRQYGSMQHYAETAGINQEILSKLDARLLTSG